MSPRNDEAISTLEYHVLLALVTGPRYGYAIKGAVETESNGVLTPLAGTLYRVIARLLTRGWVEEAPEVEAAQPHPGRERKYYGLTSAGREALRDEAHRLKGAAALAEERLGATEGRP